MKSTLGCWVDKSPDRSITGASGSVINSVCYNDKFGSHSMKDIKLCYKKLHQNKVHIDNLFVFYKRCDGVFSFDVKNKKHQVFKYSNNNRQNATMKMIMEMTIDTMQL